MDCHCFPIMCVFLIVVSAFRKECIKNNAFCFQDAGSRNFNLRVATSATGTVAPGNGRKGKITSAAKKCGFELSKTIPLMF